MLIIGLMTAAGAACAAQYPPNPSDAAATSRPTLVPSDTAIDTQPTPNRQTLSVAFSPSAVCDVVPLDEPVRAGDNTATVRIVAYGDIDSEDDMPCGMLPGVHVYAIRDEPNTDIFEVWWTTVGGDELSEKYPKLPPGVQVPTTAERLSAVLEQPITITTTNYSTGRVRFDRFAKGAEFITAATTGPDGIVELSFAFDPESDDLTLDYKLCVIAPVEYLTVRCTDFIIFLQKNSHTTAYAYFTHGHAIMEVDGNNWPQRGYNDRYQRFLDGVISSGEPAIVKFEATGYADVMVDDILPSRPAADVDVIVVGDAHINAWWAAVFSNKPYTYELYNSPEALAHDWVHVVTTGLDGLVETMIPPGDYLICSTTTGDKLVCIYENFASGSNKIQVSFWKGAIYGIGKLTGTEQAEEITR